MRRDFLYYLNKAVWHAYAIAALSLAFWFVGDMYAWHHAIYSVTQQIVRAIHGGST